MHPEQSPHLQIERDELDELIEHFERVNGPADAEAVAAKRAKLLGPSYDTEAAV